MEQRYTKAAIIFNYFTTTIAQFPLFLQLAYTSARTTRRSAPTAVLIFIKFDIRSFCARIISMDAIRGYMKRRALGAAHVKLENRNLIVKLLYHFGNQIRFSRSPSMTTNHSDWPESIRRPWWQCSDLASTPVYPQAIIFEYREQLSHSTNDTVFLFLVPCINQYRRRYLLVLWCE